MPVYTITIRERGTTPRGFKRAFGIASKDAWYRAGVLFHSAMRDERFTAEHGRKAGYQPRKGEQSGISQTAFWNSYTGQKLKKWHHKRPLEWSGETRRNVRQANITTTSNGGRVSYAGARKLNFRNPHSTIDMAAEFRKLIPEEIRKLADEYDAALDAGLKRDNTTSSRQV